MSVESVTRFRVRYSETDQMGTFYNSRSLEWFECGRTELLRAMGTPYVRMEQQGVLLPLIEAHCEYLGRAGYDDELEIVTRIARLGQARVRFDVSISHVDDGGQVVRGYTVHAITDRDGRPQRPPEWFVQALERSMDKAKRAIDQRREKGRT